MDRKQVYELIDGERAYQEELWNEATTTTEGLHTPEEWLVYIDGYTHRAMHMLATEAAQVSYPKAMEMIRKITAMGVAAMEQRETAPRPGRCPKCGGYGIQKACEDCKQRNY